MRPSSWSRSAWLWRARPPSPSPAPRRESSPRARGVSASAMSGTTRSSPAESRRPARASKGRRCSRCPRSTLVLPPGWTAEVDEHGSVIANAGEPRMSLDPISLGVQVGRLRAVCDEMGAVLIRSAHSPNIKERRDCSTALFEPGGELVMQAEHIPVHLGSMPDAVAAILDEEQRPGESWILNDPFRGGTHLPDITLDHARLLQRRDLAGFVASRAHHADVGGPTPGSMPANSRSLEEEGVVIPPTRLADRSELEDITAGMRNRPQRVADLRAQLAANDLGARRLGRSDRVPTGCPSSRRRCERSSTTRSAAPGRASRNSGMASGRRATCSRAAPTGRRTSNCA